ncbi:MAG: malate dehydrogenase [Candidatus Electryonea clarkiae]|nr:malate dehydrogenase [Candidatus Electryonea clarkiae]MDP8286028.1 malate dehydrogenase [Candidatus Electryonea clarkiae]
MVKKITVIGAGYVGEHVAQALMLQELTEEVVLIDVLEDMPQGKGLDQRQSSTVWGTDTKVTGTNDWADTADSDIVIHTAGRPRKPGMSRDDLLNANVEIVRPCMEKVKEFSPDAIVIMVANPLDAMAYVALKVTGFPSNRVFGMAGILDTARFRAFISMETGVSVRDIQAMVLGGHGDTMVPLPRFTTIAGLPLSHWVSQDKIDAMVKRAAGGGGEIVKLLKFGSAYMAPAAGAVEMAEAIIKNSKRVLPCCCWLQGEYGHNDIYMGVPIIIGENGVEKIIEYPFNDEEQASFDHSVDAVKGLLADVAKFL